jgi:S-DNA-T family DNA segregation ATPase FtsK/SpoIIIE
VKLKLVYERTPGRTTDITVTVDPGATVGEVAVGIAEADPGRAAESAVDLTLEVSPPLADDFAPLSAEQAIGDVAVASGYRVRLIPDGSAGRRNVDAALVVRVTGGPDHHREVRLPEGAFTIGRDPDCDLVLNDPLVSKRHARVEVRDVAEIVDLNSANGLLVDGGLVARLALRTGTTVTLGDTELTFERLDRSASATSSQRIHAGAIPFNRSPRVEVRYPGREFPRPSVPVELEKAPFPWLLMIAPILLGLSMFMITKRVYSLLFVVMTPMMMVGNYMMTRKRQRAQRDHSVAKFLAQLENLESALEEQRPVEQRVRLAEAPGVQELLQAGINHEPQLFTRRPEHWNFLNVRLGIGTTYSRNTVAEQQGIDDTIPEYAVMLDEIVDKFRFVPGVPINEDPMIAGALGVAGERGASAAALRNLLVQLAALHSPAELVMTALAGPAMTAELEWMKWLPHTSSAQSPLTSPPLADSVATATRLLAELEELVDQRASQRDGASLKGPLTAGLAAVGAGSVVGEEPPESWPPLPIVVVVIAGDVPADRGRLVQLTERAASSGVVPIWLASEAAQLPAACRTYLDLAGGLERGRVEFVRHGVSVPDVAVDGVTRDEAIRFSMLISALVDSGAVVADSSDLPRTVSLLSLIGTDMAESSSSVVDRWRQNDSIHNRTDPSPTPLRRHRTLRAIVGQSASSAMHLDLRGQGPHALVGGTTGAGKSEFLQAWVLGMAAEHSPDRVTFLFVDYKGGAAFADCVKLPHCVGLVTDLSPHLVRRALTSLRAELRHREHLLNRKKAKDLVELEKRGDVECPPALVLVIDEFAALVNDVPDFVDGVVDIAQRGRSLGIHLIMATQRPAGVIKDNLRANTNLRVALRMADEMDSADVVGTAEAAAFDPSLPGRGVAKTGPGRLLPFQSAYAGGWTTGGDERHDVAVTELRFGAEVPWPRPEAVDQASDPGPTDQARLVESIVSAASSAEIPEPRRPWLNELAGAYDLARLGPRNDRQIVFGFADVPEEQKQEPVYFYPDTDGHLAVYGTGGAGKSVLLRTIAAAAGVTPRGGPVEVYALDFAAGGLRMLETLPHVGAVISGDDHERVVRLFRTLKARLEQRSREYPAHSASTVAEYRVKADRPEEPRILLLIDGYPAFRDDFEAVTGRNEYYSVFQQLLNEGRSLGMHVILTADRPGSVPSSVASSVPRRVVMRLAEDTMYTLLDVEADVITPASPPGRAIVDSVEVQVAILGGAPGMSEQAAAMHALARAIRDTGRQPAPPIGSLPTEYPAADLPNDLDGSPVLGISDVDLAPLAFEPSGVFLLGGGPYSGRTNGLLWLVGSLERALDRPRMFYLGNRRSPVAALRVWERSATSLDDIAALAKELNAELSEVENERCVVVIEGLAEAVSSIADGPLLELVKTVKRSDHFLVAESETSTWTSSWPLLNEVKSARRGLLLQPDAIEGDTIMRTAFPRVKRADFPPGRGLFVHAGKVVTVQLPLV